MAYMNQERKAKISAALRPVLARYGVKGTLSVRNHMAIVLTLKSGAIDFIQNFNETHDTQGRPFQPAQDYLDVNPYWFQDHFSGTAKAFLTEAFQALRAADYYDNSDAMTDYFDTAYYYDLQIGRWNRPYTVTA